MCRSELKNIDEHRPDEAPKRIGYTVVAKSKDGQPKELLQAIKEVWKIVAQWGRWADESMGKWPPDRECLKRLPEWLQGKISEGSSNDFENWLDDLHDRAWIWWSGVSTMQVVKIDLESESAPVSLWPMKFLIESAGGKILYQNRWIASTDVKDIVN